MARPIQPSHQSNLSTSSEVFSCLCKLLPLVDCFRLALFLWENLGDCIKDDSKKAAYQFFPIAVIMFEGFLLSFTAAYVYERAVIYVLLNMTMACVTLKLMLHNMAKRHFSLWHMAFLYPLVPFLASFTGVEWFVLGMNRLMAIAASGHFLFDMYVLSRQFMAHSGRTFFIRSTASLSSNIPV